MIPPRIPAPYSNFEPNTFPIFTPSTEKTKVVTPMINTDDQILTCIQAKEIPTAKASILVATAKYNISSFPFSVLRFPFSVLRSPFSVLRFPFSVLRFPFSVLLFTPHRLANHVGSNQKEQTKGNPMIHRGDELLELSPKKITNHRHQGLKKAKLKPTGQSHLT